MKLVSQALLVAQKKIKNAKKDSKNPHFKNVYSSLESVLDAVKEAANSSGILLVQTNDKDEKGHYVLTRLIHAESGESIDSRLYLLIAKNDMQGLGSALTYARRYELMSMFGITGEDDDANASTGVELPTFDQFEKNGMSQRNGFTPRQNQQQSKFPPKGPMK